jgi:hypothetical protein
MDSIRDTKNSEDLQSRNPGEVPERNFGTLRVRRINTLWFLDAKTPSQNQRFMLTL